MFVALNCFDVSPGFALLCLFVLRVVPKVGQLLPCNRFECDPNGLTRSPCHNAELEISGVGKFSYGCYLDTNF